MKKAAAIWICMVLLLQIAWTNTAYGAEWVDPPLETNARLVYETSFENANDQTWLSGVTRYDSTEHAFGSSSLKYNRTAAGDYTIISKALTKFAPGKEYYATAWIKTQGLSGAGGGKVAIEAFDANGAWLGGKYGEAVKAGDWTSFKLDKYSLPANAAKVLILLYLDQNTTGTAWFDGLKVYGIGDVPVADPEPGAPEPPARPNAEILYQTSFEEPHDPEYVSSSTRYDAGQFRSGSHSLQYARTDAADYVLVRKTFPVAGGQAYYVSGFAKALNLVGEAGKGAKIAIEAFDADGNWILGRYSNAATTNEWTNMATDTYSIPPNATHIKLVVYVEKGVTGTVWFDDIKLYQIKTNVLSTELISPSYRGLLMEGDHTEIKVRTRLDLGANDANRYSTLIQLVDSANQTIASKADPTGQADFTAAFPAQSLPSGSYKVKIEVTDKTSNTVSQSDEWAITKLGAADPKPKSYVDKHGRLLIDGKPFFPLGLYFGFLNDGEINELKNSPFNTALPYQFQATTNELLDKLNQAGIKYIHAVKDKDTFFSGPTLEAEAALIAQQVNKFKNHPSLLAWYINDEMNKTVWRDNLIAHNKAIAANDFNHPSYTVDMDLPNADLFMKSTDIFGTDPYPVYGKPEDAVSRPGEWSRSTKAELPNRAMWHVVQAHNLSNYDAGVALRAPNLAELRSMSWQSIAEGATGLMYYSYFDILRDASGTPYETLWGNLKQVGQEIKPLIPVIMSVEPTPNVQLMNGGSWLNWTVRQHEGKTYVIAVNNGKEARQASFKVPNATGVKVVHGNRSIPVTDGAFTDSFEALGVRVYEVSTAPQDTTPPTATVAYSQTTPTSGSVKATITLNEPATIINNGGSSSYDFQFNGSFTFEFADAAGNRGTATATVNNIISNSKAKPSTISLTHDNGWDNGIQDGKYNVKMDLWSGNNGKVYKLFEDDVWIDTKILPENSPSAQHVQTAIANKTNGTYRYVAELTNAFGTTRSSMLTVQVSQANPAKPVLSNNNWDGDGTYAVTMNMWWGTNGRTYNLYENGILIHTQELNDNSPNALSVAVNLANRAKGSYEYRGELVNYAGATSSDTMIVKVTK